MKEPKFKVGDEIIAIGDKNVLKVIKKVFMTHYRYDSYYKGVPTAKNVDYGIDSIDEFYELHSKLAEVLA